MGIGLMFYGVGEPLSHFTSPPPGTVAAGTPEAFDVAMATTLFHWTLHPWAIYAVVGLAIAYSTFRRGRPQLISSAFIPLFGRQRPRARSAGRRHPGDLRDAVRLGRLARARRPADRRRAHRRRLHGQRRHHPAGRDHRGADDLLHPLGGVRRLQGHPVAVEHQHGARRDPRPRRVRRRPHDRDPQPAAHRDRRLLRRPRADGRPHRSHRRRRDRHLARRLDGLLLGVVDLLDAVRRHVHRAHQPRPHDPPVRLRASSSFRARSACSGSRSSAARRSTSSAAAPTSRPCPSRASCSGCSTRCRSARCSA